MRISDWSSDVCSSDLASPVHLECRYLQTVDLPSAVPGTRNAVVFGQVIGIHIDESVLTNGKVDIAKLKPVSRLGYMDYCVVEDVFAMARPAWPVQQARKRVVEGKSVSVRVDLGGGVIIKQNTPETIIAKK